MAVNVLISEEKMREMMTRRGGSVERYMNRKGAQVVNEAKRLSTGVLVNVQTGRYRSGFRHKVTTGPSVGDTSEMTLHVGNDVEYAIYLELGTRHISPRLVLTTALRNSAFR